MTDYASMTRRELQAEAKRAGIRANQKSSVLIAELEKSAAVAPTLDEPEMDVEMEVAAASPVKASTTPVRASSRYPALHIELETTPKPQQQTISRSPLTPGVKLEASAFDAPKMSAEDEVNKMLEERMAKREAEGRMIKPAKSPRPAAGAAGAKGAKRRRSKSVTDKFDRAHDRNWSRGSTIEAHYARQKKRERDVSRGRGRSKTPSALSSSSSSSAKKRRRTATPEARKPSAHRRSRSRIPAPKTSTRATTTTPKPAALSKPRPKPRPKAILLAGSATGENAPTNSVRHKRAGSSFDIKASLARGALPWKRKKIASRLHEPKRQQRDTALGPVRTQQQ